MAEFLAILDFGSQYTQLIARRVRENRVYCEILPHGTTVEDLKKRQLKGIILSGGPSGVYEEQAPRCDERIFSLGVPVLGICYGMQLGCEILGAKVIPARHREYGETVLDLAGSGDDLFHGLKSRIKAWMSHGDRVDDVGGDFQVLARTQNCPYAAVAHSRTRFYGVQFHPEVTHTPEGGAIINNFLYRICQCTGDWTLSGFIDDQVKKIRKEVGRERVVCALSGGVDSSVVALLLHRALGSQLICVFVDNGLLRQGEKEQVEATFREHFHLNFHLVVASSRFLQALKGVTDPETKRIRIGHEFIEVFRDATRKFEGVRYLAQGTLYPDTIESRSPFGGPSAVIKSHHNVGGLPEKLGFELVEPLKFLFKDEVRNLGRELGLPDEIIQRQPFPGPGLAIRVIGEVTAERLKVLREADAIVQEEIRALDLHRNLWQSFAILLPVRTVGVMGDRRTYDAVIALRIVESTDGMTANWVFLPSEVLTRIANRICNEVVGVNRVVLDISSKPPSTIEWE
ncbi:MAG: glutamine-hydrolyzing GMP synthase [Planctomycetes bacterium]|nr:glutamine-hydrolyzing GMP synthase [Planctomycetota bacterium]